nr:peptidoglycan-binding domain-containing protein [Desulfonatronum thiosulfatophilum]
MTTKQAQMRLLYLGYHEVGIADGIMGAKTREALRNFQQDRGIPVTGKIDPATREELMKK